MIRTIEVLALAARGVSRNRRRTIITGIMIALGVISVVFARGYIAGLQVMMTESVIDERFGAIQVSRLGYHASAELAPLDVDLPAEGALFAALAGTDGVVAVAGRLNFVGMISKGESSQVFTGLGLDPGREPAVCPSGPAVPARARPPGGGTAFHLESGQGLGPADGVVLGRELADSLDAKVGDAVTLLVQTRSGSVDAVDAHVSGIFLFDQPQENRRGVVIPLALAQRVTHMPGRVTAFAVRVADRGDIPRVAAALPGRLVGADIPPVEVLTWEELGRYFRDTMRLQDTVLGAVMFVIFVLLLTGIANTMLMAVFERTREVGTLMCLGMRRPQIVSLFALEAMLVATLAALVGTSVGIAIVKATHAVGLPFFIPAVGDIMVRPMVDPRYVVGTFIAAIFTALLAALYPAWRASRMNPVVALRAT